MNACTSEELQIEAIVELRLTIQNVKKYLAFDFLASRNL